jgi:hypothetical protein
MSQQPSREFASKEIFPGTFDVHFYKPGSTSLVADVLEELFCGTWTMSGHRYLLRTLRWTLEGGSGLAALDSVRVVTEDYPVEKEAAEIKMRVGLSGSDGGVCLATVRIFVHELPSDLVKEIVGDRSDEDILAMALLRKRVRPGEVCPHCFKPVADCDCCDADVDPEMGAKG